MTRAYNTATTQQNSGGAVAGVTAGKNAYINGAMDFWQRGTSFTTTSGYTADRFFTYKAAGSHTITRQVTGDTTNLPFIQYCARVQRNSGQTNTDRTQFYQPFDTLTTIPFAGKTVTLSFYARRGANYSPTGNQLEYYLGTGTGTDQQPINGYTGGAQVAAGNITLTTTWQRFSITGTLASNATEMFFVLLSNWTGTAGADDWYETTGYQLEVGSVATPFSRAGGTIANELAACQRYYVRWGGNSATEYLGYGFANNTSGGLPVLYYPVQMRTAPTAADYSGLRLIQYDSSGNFINNAVTSITLSSAGNKTSMINSTTAGTNYSATGQSVQLQTSSTSGYIGLSAEL